MKNSTKNFLKLSSIVLSTTFILISCGSSREEKANQETSSIISNDSIASTTEKFSSQKEPVSPNPHKNDSLRAL
jgi:ABC-type enterochelin transport system substrate-binding protein